MKKQILVILLLAASVGCLNQNSETSSGGKAKVKGAQFNPEFVQAMNRFKEANSKVKFDDELYSNTYKNENTAFARKLLSVLPDESKNRVISPLSYELALRLLQQGAEGPSRQALVKALNLKAEQESLEGLERELANLVGAVTDPGAISGESVADFSVGFGMAMTDKYKLNPKVVPEIESKLGAMLKTYDFVNDSAQAVKEINDWVSEQTQQKVKDLLSQIPEDSLMVLLNTIYLKVAWSTHFKEEFNEKMDFTTDSGVVKKMTAMKRQGKYNYRDDKDFEMVEIQLDNRDLSFMAFRPKGNLKQFKKRFQSSTLEKLLPVTYYRKVDLAFPKFKVSSDIDLTDTLKPLGLGLLVEDSNYDLSQFFTKKHNIVVGKVKQGTFFALNEKGIEAAAATAIVMKAGAGLDPNEPIKLVFDKPFLFVVYSKTAGSILFLGEVHDPKWL